jgi:hypothetical protein
VLYAAGRSWTASRQSVCSHMGRLRAWGRMTTGDVLWHRLLGCRLAWKGSGQRSCSTCLSGCHVRCPVNKQAHKTGSSTAAHQSFTTWQLGQFPTISVTVTPTCFRPQP